MTYGRNESAVTLGWHSEMHEGYLPKQLRLPVARGPRGLPIRSPRRIPTPLQIRFGLDFFATPGRSTLFAWIDSSNKAFEDLANSQEAHLTRPIFQRNLAIVFAPIPGSVQPY